MKNLDKTGKWGLTFVERSGILSKLSRETAGGPIGGDEKKLMKPVDKARFVW